MAAVEVFLVLTYVHDLLVNMAINAYMTAAATILQNKPSICVHRRRDAHPPSACLPVRQKERQHAMTVRNQCVLVCELTFPVDFYVS
jgi:hypothetical protein